MRLNIVKFNEIATKMLRVYISVEFNGLDVKDEDIAFHYPIDYHGIGIIEGRVRTLPDLVFYIKIEDRQFNIYALKTHYYPVEMFELSKENKDELYSEAVEVK